MSDTASRPGPTDLVSSTTLHEFSGTVSLMHEAAQGYYFTMKMPDHLTFPAAERLCDLLRAEMSRARAADRRRAESLVAELERRG